MKSVLVLSAHLDDAAFSVGPLFAEWAADARVTVATVFTQSVANPEGFALACQLDKGLAASVDYLQIRRNEDMAWSEKLGVEVVHGPFPEAPHRGYHSAKELFEAISPNDDIAVHLKIWMEDLIVSSKPDLVLVPLAIGNHVDHQWVRKIAEAVLPNRHFLAYYKDQPYAEKSGNSVAQTYASDHGQWLQSQVPLSQDSLNRALAATETYQTQLPFQFGGVEQMRELLGSAWGRQLTIYHTVESPALNALFSTPISP